MAPSIELCCDLGRTTCHGLSFFLIHQILIYLTDTWRRRGFDLNSCVIGTETSQIRLQLGRLLSSYFANKYMNIKASNVESIQLHQPEKKLGASSEWLALKMSPVVMGRPLALASWWPLTHPDILHSLLLVPPPPAGNIRCIVTGLYTRTKQNKLGLWGSELD